MNDIFDIFESERQAAARVLPIISQKEDRPDEEELHAGDMVNLPILPLRNMVVLPGMTTPIAVGREKSMRLIREAMKHNARIGVVCQKDGDVEDPARTDLYDEGTVAEILKVLELPDDSTNIILHARSGFALGGFTSTEPYLRANVTILDDRMPAKNDKEFTVLMKSIMELTMHMIKNMGESGKELAFALKNIDSPIYLMNFLATNIPFEPQQKQQLLTEHDIKKRGYMLYGLLSKEAQLVEIKANIQSRTREDLSQQQREHFLQQQIRTIQEELGAGSDDIDELEERAKGKKWGDEVQKQFEKELRKLERLNPQSPDYSVQYNYLDQLISLPWGKYTKDTFDLAKVERKLDHDHYGLEKVKERILEHLAVLKLRGDLKAPILCLYGPPGVGKTSLGKSIAEALNRKYERIALGGLHDEAEIRGHRRTYIGAMPGRIISAIIHSESSNPVIVLDEIDKVGQDFKGDPSSALLEVLDPEQNGRFHDNFIDVDYDLSKVLFIATANSLSTVSRPLLDRMEIIEITGYIPEEKYQIARHHLIPKELEANGFARGDVKFTKEAILNIIDNYTRESGVRELEKKIAKVLRKLARKRVRSEELGVRSSSAQKNISTLNSQLSTLQKVTAKDIAELLGPPDYNSDKYEGNEFAGVVTGLAWTSVGGVILFVESSLSRGKGSQLSITGNIGAVMKESAQLAMQYLRAHSAEIGIDDDLFDKYNVHIHVPEGATPKDGPSAGITMVTSLASSFTQRRVRDHLAMTGEITLRGKVLPVGGIKEKILAAKRAGITDIILCKENKKDIEEINEIYLEGLTFHYVNTIREVLDFALLPEKVPHAREL